ncbi:MAG TPA: M91 family zinc metallopeptidase [Stellaceae bacterium]|nr:M91 family zinc metallopeptidase [Stellaceae bacterium]
MHVCPAVTGVVPHVGGPIIPPCEPTVLTGFLPQARITDQLICVGPIDFIVQGATSVLVGGLFAARITDQCAHGGKIVTGLPTVIIGDPALSNPAAAAMLQKIASGSSGISISGSPQFRQQALGALSRLALSPTGLGLLQSIDASGKTVTIQQTNGGNNENPANYANGTRNPVTGAAGPGSNSVVNWNPNRISIGPAAWQTRDPAVGLGHELIHAETDAHGTSDGQNSNYTGADGVVRNAPGYEQQAVGLGPYAGNAHTENKLRSDFNKPGASIFGAEQQRPFY